MQSCMVTHDDVLGLHKEGNRAETRTQKQNWKGMGWSGDETGNFWGGSKKMRRGYCRFKNYAYLCSVETARR